MSYNELSIEERATIQVGRFRGLSKRETARMLGRSPSTNQPGVAPKRGN